MSTLGHFLFRYRNLLFPLVILTALLTARPHYSFGGATADLLVDLLGLALVCTGQGLRILTIGYDYIRRGGRDGRVHADGLVDGGVFAHCRNPLYLGNILMAAGVLVVLGQGWLILAGVPLVILAYLAIVAAEEEFLSGRFGADYAAYCARVNRWLPRWRGFGQSVAGMRFDWRRVLVKEYNTFFALLALLVFVQTWTRLREDDMTGGHWILTLMAGGILLAAWLGVRWLKKKHWRRADSGA